MESCAWSFYIFSRRSRLDKVLGAGLKAEIGG
jgi:hypothetical protein